jgi:hypothetical protein
LAELYVDSLAKYIAAVKADTVVPTLASEFHDRVHGLGGE